MKIKFESPISFTLDIIENDERTPAICVDVKITVMQFQNRSEYDGTFWIQCEVWDNFVKLLHGPFEQRVALHDISECFEIAIQNVNGRLLFTWDFTKEDIGVSRQMNISFKSDIDDDVLSKIRNEFLSFPAWW